MKKLIIIQLAAVLSFAGVSCSVQEDITTTEQENAVSMKDGEKIFGNKDEFSKAFAEGLKDMDIKIDFVTLFKYNDESELKLKSERLFKTILPDMPYEMTYVKGAANMVVTVDVANGRAATTGVYFLNEKKDFALQHSTPTPDNEYDVEYNVPFQMEAMGYTLVKDGIDASDASMLSDYLLTKTKGQGTGSFMVVSSAEKISLYLKS